MKLALDEADQCHYSLALTAISIEGINQWSVAASFPGGVVSAIPNTSYADHGILYLTWGPAMV